MSESIQRIEPIADPAAMGAMIISIAHHLDGLARIDSDVKEQCLIQAEKYETIEVFSDRMEQTGPMEPGVLVTTMEASYASVRNSWGLNEGYGVSLHYADGDGKPLYADHWLLRLRANGDTTLSTMRGLDQRWFKWRAGNNPDAISPGLHAASMLEVMWLRSEIERLYNSEGPGDQPQKQLEVV